MASQVKEAAWLEWIASLTGTGSRRTHTATLPPDQFHCLLDELPLHLIPQWMSGPQRCRQDLREQLYLNPQCLILPAGQVPAEFESHRHTLQGFNLQNTVAWVRDPGTGAVQPFWLGPRLEAVVSGLRAGEPVSLPDKEQLLLAEAGILTPLGHAERRIAEWTEIASASAKVFREKGYVPLGGLIHPYNLAALRRYYRHAIRRGALRLGDQTPQRYVAHNESVGRFFHYQIANAVSAIVGEAIKPSYAYLASYLSGAALKRHTDRQQCEFSVTLCLDFSPEPELATSWPIRLDTSEGTVTVYQALGDALIYRGTKVPHYRLPLEAGHTSTSILFHYVRPDFSDTLD